MIKPKRNPFLRQEEQNQTTHRQTKNCACFHGNWRRFRLGVKQNLCAMWISTWHFFSIIEDNVINVKFVKLACIPKNQEVYYQYQIDTYRYTKHTVH